MIKVFCGDMNLSETLLSGQCFRVCELENGSFDVILSDRVINVFQRGSYLFVNSNNYDDLENVVINYFDLNRNYSEIINNIKLNNLDFSDVLDKCSSYRILRQDPLEMLFSYIISQNNNVKRIMGSIELFCKLYGNVVNFRDKEYYLFPTYDRIIELNLEDLQLLKIGFRDKYILSAIEFLKHNKDFVVVINNMSTSDALNYLMQIKGVGMKVASCILLFGFARFDVFPIDTWVIKFVKNFYGFDGNVLQIKVFLEKKFDKNVGLCIQYMFHYNRNIKEHILLDNLSK